MPVEESPSLQLYPEQFLSDERFILMGPAPRGVLFTLYMHAWRHFSIPADEGDLARLNAITPSEFKPAWQKAKLFFEPHPDEEGRLICPIAEEQREGQRKRRGDKSAAGKAGAEKRWGKNDHKSVFDAGVEYISSRESWPTSKVKKFLFKHIRENGMEPVIEALEALPRLKKPPIDTVSYLAAAISNNAGKRSSGSTKSDREREEQRRWAQVGARQPGDDAFDTHYEDLSDEDFDEFFNFQPR